MAIKLEVKNLYKVFGEHPQRAFKYIEKGKVRISRSFLPKLTR
ncbi:TPA: hypothetical protein ACF3JC_003224, partial [Enterobacter hormaechei]